jgi:hypothetical protein
MARGNTKFTARVRKAVEALRERETFASFQASSSSLFSPVLRNGAYTWMKVMDSDGTLISRRAVKGGEGAAPRECTHLLISVVLQSEDATSQTKPNPLGKAAIAHARNGVWVDIEGHGRRRLDRVYVLFIVPKGADPAHRRKYVTAKRNVQNAAEMIPDCNFLEVRRGIGARSLAEKINAAIGSWVRGKGRPSVARRSRR